MSNNEVTPVKKVEYIKHQKFTFKEDEVTIQAGGMDLNFEYDPSINARATSVAYEYKFSNSMNKLMAVSLKAIDTTGVTVSYAYSDTKLSSVTETSTPFEAPTIASKSAKYIYIVVSATSSIPTTFTSSIVWYQGEAGTFRVLGSDVVVKTVVKGQPITELDMPVMEEDTEIEGYYLDAECTVPATFPLKGGDDIIYVKYPSSGPSYEANLPDDWIAYDSAQGVYYVTTGTSALPLDLIIPSTYQKGSNPEAPLTYIEMSDEMYEPMLYRSVLTESGYEFNSIYFSQNITIIDENAFYYCTSLTMVVLPASLTSIGSMAFHGCNNLATVYNPSSLIIVAGNTTHGRVAYNATEVINSVPGGDATIATNEVINGVVYSVAGDKYTAICLSASTTTSITLDSRTTGIITEAFKGTNLSSVDFSNCTNLTTIEEGAFYQCAQLTSVDLSACTGLTSISAEVFYECKQLASVVLPSGLTSIEDRVFDWCSGLTSVYLPSSLTSIGNYAFHSCSGLTSITIPSGVISIGEAAFHMCNGLTSIVVESGNSVYDSRNNCNAIIETNTNTLITGCNNTVIPSDIEVIGYGAFEECYGLTSVTLPSSLTSMGNSAFESCSGLTSIDLSQCTSLTSIGNYAFHSCSGLTSIDLSQCTSLTSIGNNSFSYCSGLTTIDLSKCTSLTSIGNSAFSLCSGLTTIDLSKCTSLTSIGNHAFFLCSGLTSIDLPNSLITIGEKAFWQCGGLTSIYIPSNVTKIGASAFLGCHKLAVLHFNDASTWYRVSDEINWNNMTGGTETDVTSVSTNVTYFTSTYDNYYWYKL